jgi:hypothetical protein
MFEAIVDAHPGDEALALRLSQVRENLQPMELHSPKARGESPKQLEQALTPEQEGERLFAQGDYVGAAAAYRRALKDRPDSELLKERLVEIFQLAQATTPGPRKAPNAAALAEAQPSAPAAPEDLLKSLLARISERRREP